MRAGQISAPCPDADCRFAAGHAGRELADDFLDDVFDGDEPEQFAIFVDDETGPLAIFLEESQLGKDGGAGGNIVGRLNLLEQRGFIELGVADAAQQTTYRQYAQKLIKRLAADRQPAVMAGRELGKNFFPRQFKIEDFDIAAWSHDAFDRNVIKVEQAGKDGMVLLRHQVGRFEYQAAQFLRRKSYRISRWFGREAEQGQQPAGKQVDEPHHRVKQTQERGEDVAQKECDAIRMSGANDFRGNLGEDKNGKGYDQRSRRQRPFFLAEQLDGDDAHQCCRC